jgi:hypothetical protein
VDKYIEGGIPIPTCYGVLWGHSHNDGLIANTDV